MTVEPYASARRVFWIVDNGSSHRGAAAIRRLESQWPASRLVGPWGGHSYGIPAAVVNQGRRQISVVGEEDLAGRGPRGLARAPGPALPGL